MKAVQREDFDGLAEFPIKAGHLSKFLWVGHKAGVQLLIAFVYIGDHQHHELHRSSPWFLFWSYTLSRLAAPTFDTHPNHFFSISWSRRSKYRRSGASQHKGCRARCHLSHEDCKDCYVKLPVPASPPAFVPLQYEPNAANFSVEIVQSQKSDPGD